MRDVYAHLHDFQNPIMSVQTGSKSSIEKLVWVAFIIAQKLLEEIVKIPKIPFLGNHDLSLRAYYNNYLYCQDFKMPLLWLGTIFLIQ